MPQEVRLILPRPRYSSLLDYEEQSQAPARHQPEHSQWQHGLNCLLSFRPQLSDDWVNYRPQAYPTALGVDHLLLKEDKQQR